MPPLSNAVRNVFALSLMLAGYGLLLWAYESKLAGTFGDAFAGDAKAIFARDHDRDRMIEREFDVTALPVFTPPADTMEAAPLDGDPDAG